jgi:DNA-binding CsgD family transcriptional regulator
MISAGADNLRATDRVRALCRDVDDERAMRIALLDEVRRHVEFDVFVWLLTDPETEVGSAPLASAPSLADLPRLIRAKYLTSTNRWTSLPVPAATLVNATRGDRRRSLMWRELSSTYSVADVASIVFRDPHGCWGWLDLWRCGEQNPFTAADVNYLTAVARPITEALRHSQARTFARRALPLARTGPVVLVLSPTLEVKAQTPETEAYLQALLPPEDNRRPIPAAAYNVAAQLLAVEAGVDDHQPSTRVHLHSAAWLTLRAARVNAVGAPDEQDIAVTMEPASSTDRRTLFVKSHALTAREAALIDHLALGADTRTMARELFLSEHTIQDHLKSIFAKTGVHNRRTLLSRLTSP